MNSDISKGFSQGYICAVATLMRNHGEETYVKELLGCLGESEKQLKKLGCERYDLEILRPFLRKN